jgi:hypothetical protein
MREDCAAGVAGSIGPALQRLKRLIEAGRVNRRALLKGAAAELKGGCRDDDR